MIEPEAPSTPARTFGQKIRRAMVRWSWTAEALAQATALNCRTIQSILADEHRPKQVTQDVVTEAINNPKNYRVCDCCRGTGQLPIGVIRHRHQRGLRRFTARDNGHHD